MSEACFMLFAKFYLSELLLLVAVVTAYYAQCGINGVEDCSHRLVVGDALGVIAFHDSLQCIRSLHCLLFNDFVVLDNTQTDVWSYYRETVDLFVGKEFVGNLDDALLAGGCSRW